MNVLIIEDETPAAHKLQKALVSLDVNIQVVATPGSVSEALNWLRVNPMPALIFMDIELSDGLSFQLFNLFPVTCPVIFTTAYDEHWQEAFEHNSIDYLLKPVKLEKLQMALKKYHALSRHFTAQYQQWMHWQQQKGDYKKRVLVKRGTEYVSIKCEEIAYFYASHKVTCLVAANSEKFILDKSLAEIEKEMDPARFFRINRKYLVSINAIKKIRTLPKSKLLLELVPPIVEEIIISQENAGSFKAWVET